MPQEAIETMSDPRDARVYDDDVKGKEAVVTKIAGFVVFSGIAMSILKAFFHKKEAYHRSPPFLGPKELIMSIPLEKTRASAAPRTIKIEKEDTLWGLSRKQGVSIDAIKEANGLMADTIDVEKKLVIP